MKKIFIALVLFIFGITQVALADPELRDYNGVELPAGTFIQVISMQEISTLSTDENNTLRFVATNDTFMFDTNLIPKGTMFFGKIEKKNEPIIGTNASMVIRITKLRFADGYENPLYAYIYSNNSCLIGGEMTEPASYDTIPHYHKGICRHYLGVLKWVPGPSRKMGEHVTIAPGAELLIMLKGPAYLTHSLSD